jgi:hypothetical protein
MHNETVVGKAFLFIEGQTGFHDAAK